MSVVGAEVGVVWAERSVEAVATGLRWRVLVPVAQPSNPIWGIRRRVQARVGVVFNAGGPIGRSVSIAWPIEPGHAASTEISLFASLLAIEVYTLPLDLSLFSSTSLASVEAVDSLEMEIEPDESY